MRTNVEKKIGSTMYNRVLAVSMSEHDRERALNALYDAERIVDAFVWVAKKIERFGARLFLRQPTAALKH